MSRDVVLVPSTLALLQTSFDEGPERTRAVSWYAAVAGVAATAGLVLGGMFAGWLSWRVGFFVNLPIGVAMMLAARRVLPETPPRRGRADATGAVASTLARDGAPPLVTAAIVAGLGVPGALIEVSAVAAVVRD